MAEADFFGVYFQHFPVLEQGQVYGVKVGRFSVPEFCVRDGDGKGKFVGSRLLESLAGNFQAQGAASV